MLDKLLNRPVSVTMVLLVFIVLGLIGIGKLPVSLIPDVDIPYVTVQISDPGMSARTLDEAVVSPLRQSLMQINHLKDIKSESKDGSATITLTFEEGRDIDYFYIEANEKVDRAMSSLPKMDRPKVFKASATDIPAFFMNISLREGGDFRHLSEFASNVIARRIEQLPEVAMVDISGCSDSEILIIPDQDALKRVGMSLDQFESDLSAANVSLSNLTIRDGEYHYNVKFHSFASSAEDISRVYVHAGDRMLQIKDVADVSVKEVPRSGMVMSDGKDAVSLAVIKQSEARMSDLKKAIDEQVRIFGVDYPEVEFIVTRDQTELLEYSIRNLLLNIILAVLLDCIIIFLFMKDFKSPFLVAFTIPVSLVISFFVFYGIGISINIISLSGLLLGMGMMVDNTIVLTDNITGRWNRGEGLRKAVVEGTKEVSGAMLSSVLTTCAVFIPLVFLNGLAGELFFDQAVAVTVILLTSYLVTVIVIPVYYWVLYKKQDAFKPDKFLGKLEVKGAVPLYDKVVSFFLGHRWLAWALPCFCTLLIVLCAAFMQREKLPPISYSDAIINIDWNEHIAIDVNKARVARLQESIQDDCDQITAMVGVQQFVLGHSGDPSMTEASIYFRCKSPKAMEKVKARLDETISREYPAAGVSFSSSGNIFDMVFAEKEPQLLARIRSVGIVGLEVESLRETINDVRAAVPEVDIDDIPVKTDILYISDPEKMALYGISFSQLTDVLANSLNGNRVFEIVRGDMTLPVVMGTDVRDMDQLLSEKIGDIPVRALMRQSWDSDFKALIAGAEGGYYPLPLDVKSSQVRKLMPKVTSAVRQSGRYDVSFAGSWFSNAEMVRQMTMILLIAISLLFLILASQFESLLQPVIILSEIVIDIAFSLAIIWILGVSINLMSLIGLVVICGIVINDSILKIDTINRLVRQGMAVESAIHEAGHRRLKAIIMTSLTTILAVLPFLSRGNMGDDLQYPMALVVVIGMTIGTLVSLFYVPTVYSAIYRRK